MDSAEMARRTHRDSRLDQLVRVRLAFVAEDVEFGGDDERWWQAGQLIDWCEQRRGGWTLPYRWIRDVLVPEPARVFLRQPVTVAELVERLSIESSVDGGAEQDLMGEIGSLAAFGHQRDDG